MSIPRLWFAWLALVSLAPAAEPEAEVRDAIARLLNTSGYRWRRWDILPTAAQHKELTKKGVFGYGPVPQLVWAGVADRAGLCLWQTEIEQRRVTGVVDGPRRAVECGSGWQTWPEFRAARDALQLQRVTAGQSGIPPEFSWEGTILAAEDAFVTPADYLRRACEGTVLYERDGEMIRSVFTDPGVEALLGPESRWQYHRNNGGAVRDGQGSAIWWLKDGIVVKIEIHVEGYFAPSPPGFGEMYLWRTVVLTFSDAGAAEPQLAPDARAALGRNPPAAATRRRR